MRKTIVLSLMILVLGIAAQAQALKPVKWSYSVKKVSADEYDLIFTATIDDTWHLYSQNIGEGGPVPTSFVFTPDKGYTLVGKVEEKGQGEKVHDQGFNMDLIYFSHKADFVQRIKVTKAVSKVTGSLEFMACDASKCLPPETIKFSFNLKDAR